MNNKINLCKCGCGRKVNKNRNFIWGHNIRFIEECNKTGKTFEKMYGIRKAIKLKKQLSIINSKNRYKENNPNFKDGRSLKKIFKCIDIDCSNKVWKPNTRCKSCSNSLKRLGRKKSQEEKDKISISMKLLFKDPTKHPSWKGGISFEPYSLKFNKKLREKIRKRDNYTCQNCDKTEKEHLIDTGYVLSVHHIDYNKKNSRENNLITLCHLCNLKANFNRNYWKNYYNLKIKDTKQSHCSE